MKYNIKSNILLNHLICLMTTQILNFRWIKYLWICTFIAGIYLSLKLYFMLKQNHGIKYQLICKFYEML